MTYLARLKQRIGKEGAGGEATKGTKPSFVGFVAPGGSPSSPNSHDEWEDAAAENRRQRALDLLVENPELRLAVVCDGDGDPVPVTVVIRDRGAVEVLIPAVKFDPFALLELVGRHGGTYH